MGEGRAQKPVYFPAKPNKPSLPEASAVVIRGDWNSLGLETPEFGRQWARRGKDTNLRPDSSCTGGDPPSKGPSLEASAETGASPAQTAQLTPTPGNATWEPWAG